MKDNNNPIKLSIHSDILCDFTAFEEDLLRLVATPEPLCVFNVTEDFTIEEVLLDIWLYDSADEILWDDGSVITINE